MRIMVASDIHGSAFYCAQMLEAFEREAPDRLLLLGDILYHGPRNDLPQRYSPKSVIEQLNGIKDKILCVRGNCDTEVDQMVLQFPLSAEYCILYIEDRMIFATHGHRFHEKNPPPIQKGDILLHGHTHVPGCVEHDGYLCVNPGSVSIPKGGSEHSYIMLCDDGFVWKTLGGREYMNYRLGEGRK